MQKLVFEMYQNKNQIVQDAYDILIANMYLNSQNNPPKSICIAGCESDIGKTTISINLAIALSSAEWRVVLIDSDIRKEIAEKRLTDDKFLGLSDYLAGKAAYEDVLTSTNYPNLTLIPCGDISNKNPIGLLYSPRFQELLDRLDEDYDFLVFDTSPWDCSADASVVASKCDGTFVVAEVNKTRRDELKKVLSQLKSIRAHVIGVILNKVQKGEYKEYLGSYDYFKKKKRRRG